MRSPNSRRSAAKVEVLPISPMMEEILNRVEQFSDLDLRKELSSRSFSCGPIVGTTRSVYKKKLVDMLLDEELPAEARIARAAPSSEEEEEEEVVPQEMNFRGCVNGDRRKTPAVEVAAAIPDEEEEEEEVEEEEVVGDSQSQEESSEEEEVNEVQEDESQEDTEEEEEYDNIVDRTEPDVLRHRVPGASDSFDTKTSVAFVSEDGKTVKRTTTTTTRVVKASDVSSFSPATTLNAPTINAPTINAASNNAQPEKTKKKSSCLSILFQLIVIAIIVFFVYVIVMGPSTPLALPSKPHDEENPPVDAGAV